MIEEIKEFYGYIWDELNWFGRCLFFPVMVLSLPLVIVVVAGCRRQ